MPFLSMPALRPIHALALLALLTLSACGGSSTSSPASFPPTPTQPEVDTPPPLAGGVWMKGDMHLHSHHSTDATSPLGRLVTLAEEVGMDYFIATDHDNHVLGDVAGHTWSDPDYQSDRMVMLYGAEWTTHRGHGNVISAFPYDHQSLYDLRDDLDRRIEDHVRTLNVHFSANHPAGANDAWDFSYDMVQGIEIWNSAIWLLHSEATIIWDDLLKSGRRLSARGGSDAHHGPTGDPLIWDIRSIQGVANLLGTPTTWIYAQDRSGPALIEALNQGRVTVSANPNSERAVLYADLDRDGDMDIMMGDGVAATGEPVLFRLELEGRTTLPLYTVTIIRNGEEFRRELVAGTRFEFTDTPDPHERTYYRAEVTGMAATYLPAWLSPILSTGMLALTNPIYFNFSPRR